MKILQITNRFPPFARGGAEQVALAIESGGREAGHRMITIATRPKGVTPPQRPDTYYLPSALYDHPRLGRPTRLLLHMRTVFGTAAAEMIRPILIREQPQLVITHNLIGLDLAIPGLIAGLNIPHVHVLHDIQLLHPSGLMYRGGESIVDTLWAKAYQSFTRNKFMGTIAVVSPSAWLLDLHRSRGLFANAKSSVKLNPFGSDAIRVTDLPRGKVFLFIGQLEPHKGVLTLIEAYERYQAAQTVPWRLVIIGNGDLRNPVESFAAKHNSQVVYAPYSQEAETAWLSRAGVLVVPSVCYENSPTVIYRAAAAGLPVLASDIGGAAELAGKCRGRLFAAGDETALADALLQIQKYPDWSGIKKMELGSPAKEYLNHLLSLAGFVI